MEETITKEDQLFATDYVESKEMAETTKEKLVEFLSLENLTDWNNLPQESKSKFYDFIREAYAQGNIHVAWEEFNEVVSKSGSLTEEIIKEYYGKYQKGMELLLLSI
ncbi:MAG: hypothetical protein ACKKL6_00125 [Candidatus Komeilibacteria bacterium]